MNYSKILIAIDSSSNSLLAAKKGIELAQRLNAEVGLIFVIDPAQESVNVDAGIFANDAILILKKEGEQTLAQVAALYTGRLSKFMPEGHPTEEIISTAKAWDAQLIVMGTHGRTGLKHLLMGSVAEHVVRYSEIPVMIVPSK